jgi:hypothetical protein
VGYPDHDATWEPEVNLTNAQDIIADYTLRTMSQEGGSNVMVLQVTKLHTASCELPSQDAMYAEPCAITPEPPRPPAKHAKPHA